MAVFDYPDTLSIVAIDDEPLVLDGIVSQLSSLERVSRVQGFISPKEALDYLNEEGADVAFVDINMRGMDGLMLAALIKDACSSCSIIFLTGYAEYAIEAFKIKAFGYLLKPVTTEEISRELEGVYAQNQRDFDRQRSLIRVQTFGDFEIFVNKQPLHFPRQKCKEVLAYLVDRRGSGVTSARLGAVVWEDREYSRSVQKQIQTALSDMMKTLNDAGVGEIVIRKRNHLAIDPAKIDCDYYRLLEGDHETTRLFTGEYLAGYSWAEETAGELSRICRGK